MKKVVVIGAGPAGLTAAYELLKGSNDYEVIIFEEADSVGGISKTINFKGNRMDIGGHRFFSKNQNVTDWWLSILPPQGKLSFDDKTLSRNGKVFDGGPDPEKTDRVFLFRKRISRIFYKHNFFDYPISLKLQTIMNLGLFTTLFAGVSYLKSTLFKKNDDNLENFYINRFGKKLYSMFFEGYTEKVWGRHPSAISADWGIQRIKGLSIIAIFKDIFGKFFPNKKHKKETSLIEEFMYPKLGPGQLWETVAIEIKVLGGQIHLNSKVDKLLVKDGCILGVEITQGINKIKANCDFLISSMPLKDLISAMNTDVPANIMEIAKGLPYRDFVTIGLLLDKLSIVNETNIKTISNIIPDCWLYIQDTEVKLGRIQVFNNWSPYLVHDIHHTVWIGLEYFCNENDNFWNLNEKEAIEFAINELIQIGMIVNSSAVLDGCQFKVKKAYPAYFDTYKDIKLLISYLNGFENLYCVGRNGQHRYNNTDHSMLTSFEAVSNILNGYTNKSNIWNVNTDNEYHEKK